MSDAATPTAAPTTLDTLRQRAADAPAPVAFKDLTKGMKKPAKQSAPDFQKGLADLLEEDVQTGRLFRYPSGPKGADRYWHKDEVHAIREAVLEAAAAPAAVADLAKKAAAAVPKTDKRFAEGVVRDLIGEDLLFEYPPKKKNGPPVFGVDKPPPPPHLLDTGKAKTDFGKLVAAAQKLLSAHTGVDARDLLARLRAELTGEPADDAEPAEESAEPAHADAQPRPATPHHPVVPSAALRARILEIVEGVPAMLLSDLRPHVPAGDQGAAFDAAVIGLAEDLKVVINADADPRRFTDDERARFVRDDHGHVYTTIAKRG